MPRPHTIAIRRQNPYTRNATTVPQRQHGAQSGANPTEIGGGLPGKRTQTTTPETQATRLDGTNPHCVAMQQPL